MSTTPIDDVTGDPADRPADDTGLLRPEAPLSWGERLSALAESLDLSPGRVAVGLVAVALAGVLAWRFLAPAEPAPEMELPFAASAPGDEGDAPAGGSGPPASGTSPGAPAEGGAGAAGAAGSPAAPAGLEPAAPAEVVVHVAGAVAEPGVQRLPGGARVVDALEAAGGAESDADLGRINLAAPVQDGQQVYVPRVGEAPPAPTGGGGGGAPSAGGEGAPGTPGGAGGEATGPLVNVNMAAADELESLPGVGPATAEAIISHRERNGPFTSVDQLIDVRGIGEVKLEQLRERVTV